MTKTNHYFFVFDAFFDICFCFIRIVVSLLNFKCHFICTTMLRTTQRTDRASNSGMHIGSSTAITRPVNVDALNSCSAYKISDVCIAFSQDLLGFVPCKRCRKWPPMESSSVSVSIRLPLWLKWYQ